MRSLKHRRDSAYIFKSSGKRLAAGALDVLGDAVFYERRDKAWNATSIRRILLIRIDQLGDAIFAAPAVEYLHEIFPEASIDFLAGPWAAPLVKNFPHVSQTLVFKDNWFSPDHRAMRSLHSAKALAQVLRNNSYDLGIDLRGDLRNIALMKYAGICRIAGYGVTGGRFLLDRMPPYDFFAHQVDLNLRLIAEVARAVNRQEQNIPTKEQKFPRLLCPEEVKKAVRDRGWLSVQGPNILVHMEAGYPSKQWNVEHFIRLLEYLACRGGRITLIGLKKDGVCEDARMKPHAGTIQDLRGKTDLLELCGLIAQGDLLIGNDSAPVHIAAALGTPCIVLFSGANEPARWRPVGKKVHLLFHPVKCSPCESKRCLMESHECMDAIAVHQVESLVEEILQAKRCVR